MILNKLIVLIVQWKLGCFLKWHLQVAWHCRSFVLFLQTDNLWELATTKLSLRWLFIAFLNHSSRLKRQQTPFSVPSNPFSTVMPTKIEKEAVADGYCQECCQCGFVITSCSSAAPVQFLSLVSSMAWVLSMHNTEGNGNRAIMGNLVIERKHSNSSTNIKIPVPIQTRTTMFASSHSRHYFQFRQGKVKEFLPQFNHKSFLRV